MLARFQATGDAFYSQPEIQALGQRYQAKMVEVDHQLRGDDGCHQTVIHGDFKAANFFFSNSYDFTAWAGALDNADSTPSTSPGIALIDWQWTGLGMGVMDVVYMFATSLRADVLVRYDYRGWLSGVQLTRWFDRSQDLLRLYHRTLEAELKEQGCSYPWEQCHRDYVLASKDCQ
jgi:thiamine kinase-like enzyme